MVKDIKTLTDQVVAFRDARDWKQFHNPKDLAISLVLEATEVIEHFQWKNSDKVLKLVVDKKVEISEELADVLYCVLLLSYDCGIDIVKAFDEKMKKNNIKYPVGKARGRSEKYNEL